MSLPVVIFSLILWAVANAFPIIGIAINLTISILLLLVVCVMLLRLVEIGWGWAVLLNESEGDDAIPYLLGIFGVVGLLIGGVGCLIDTLMHAGSAPDSRIGLFVGLLFLLALQYRVIIYRHVKEPTQQESETQP